jgi:cytochrome c oxidase cbb3-type subunit 4
MLESIDINLARGVVLILLIVAFLGIWAWAWSTRRKADFHAASMLPLEEDDGRIPENCGESDGKTAGTKE